LKCRQTLKSPFPRKDTKNIKSSNLIFYKNHYLSLSSTILTGRQKLILPFLKIHFDQEIFLAVAELLSTKYFKFLLSHYGTYNSVKLQVWKISGKNYNIFQKARPEKALYWAGLPLIHFVSANNYKYNYNV
jgi:hypothetical protein